MSRLDKVPNKQGNRMVFPVDNTQRGQPTGNYQN